MLRQDRSYWYVRRAQDIVLSLLALIVLAIPMLIVALVIWIDSPGASPFFTQKRVGRNGKKFNFLNLRWMKSQCMVHKRSAYNSMFVYAIQPNDSAKLVSDMTFPEPLTLGE